MDPKPLQSLRSIDELLPLAQADSRYAPEFFHSLLTLELYSVGSRKQIKPGDFTARHFELVSFADGAGLPFIPVFSNREHVPELADGFHRVAMPGRELLELTRGNRVVLNPGRDPFKVFQPEQVATILDGLRRDVKGSS